LADYGVTEQVLFFSPVRNKLTSSPAVATRSIRSTP
jgi:hypothetical protein